MPTILLLDNNVSLLRSQPSNAKTKSRLDLALSGIVSIVSHLEKLHPYEELCTTTTTTATASGSSPVQLEFIRTATSQREGVEKPLKAAGVAEDSAVLTTLVAIRDVIERKYKNDVPVQVVLFTDTRPTKEDLSTFVFHSVVRFHIFAFSYSSSAEARENSEDSVSSNYTEKALRSFAKRHFGVFHLFGLESTSTDFAEAITNLCKRNFSHFGGSLECGHLSSAVRLFPDPNLSLSLSGVFEAEIPSSLPQRLIIEGFVPLVRIPAPPTLSRHYVCFVDSNDTHLLVLLCEKLRSEKMGALVRLGADWFGLLCSLTAFTGTETRHGLTLNILHPNLWVDGLGKLSELSVPVSETNSPSNTNQIYVDEMAWKSYLSPTQTNKSSSSNSIPTNPTSSSLSYIAPTLDQEALAAQFQRIQRYTKNLPTKKDALYNECDLIRVTARTFQLKSQLMAALKDRLESQLRDSATNSEASKILSDILAQVSSQPNDLSLAIRQPTAVSSETKKPSITLNSLLN